MKIATNTPSSFSHRGGFDFLLLGDRIEEASIIVLMLEKNWGGAHIEQINYLTKLISGYPKDVPCYLVGCESRIPDMNIQYYLMPEREKAVRSLCDEIFLRSKSIGVRGEITYRYLIDVLGYKEDQIDLIFKNNHKHDSVALKAFLAKNGCSLAPYEEEILEFQRAPFVIYERPLSYEPAITIKTPYITTLESSARLSADIVIDGNTKTLWCETSADYRQFLLSERSDAFLCVVLPFAMRAGKDIICEAPVTEQFLHNLREILIPQLCSHDPRLHPTKIIAASDASILHSGNAVATGMSCGVDSLYTTMIYDKYELKSLRLTHLYTGNYLYGNKSEIFHRAEALAKDLSLPLVKTGTNINEELKLPHVFTHFYKTLFGVLALRKLFRVYYYSTAEDFSHFTLKNSSSSDTALYELLLLNTFSCSDFQVVTGGVKSERVEKTRALCAYPPAHKFLNVCLHPEKPKNCGKCGKCMRTLLMIDMAGGLDSFRDVFDIDEYLENRLESLVYLVQEKRSIMLGEVYQHFSRVEPALMAKAEEIYTSRNS